MDQYKREGPNGIVAVPRRRIRRSSCASTKKQVAQPSLGTILALTRALEIAEEVESFLQGEEPESTESSSQS